MITCSRCGHEYEDTLKLALEGRPVCPTCVHELTAPADADGGPVRLEQRKDLDIAEFAMPKRDPKPTFFHFDTDVYGLHVGLAVCPLKDCTNELMTKWMKEAWPELIGEDEGHVELDPPDETTLADCVTITDNGGRRYRIVRIPRFDPESPIHHAVLAHETMHLVCGSLGHLGVPLDEHHEAHAYLFEYVFQRFLEFLYGRTA